MEDDLFLPGLPVEAIRKAYLEAPGNELMNGKFASPESSAALVANAFGFFLNAPARLPPLPLVPDCTWPATSIELEAVVRFPWSGGRHPCLDVLIVTLDALIGIESKRYEPFRTKAPTEWSDAFWRPVWGTQMRGVEACRDDLRNGALQFRRLDAGQLVKHAFGLRTAANRAFLGRKPILLYLYCEPMRWLNTDEEISSEDRLQHRNEIDTFANIVRDNEVSFRSCCYTELLSDWMLDADEAVKSHAAAANVRFL